MGRRQDTDSHPLLPCPQTHTENPMKIPALILGGLIAFASTASCAHESGDAAPAPKETWSPLAQSLALKLMGAVVAMMAVVAMADYLFQYRQWYERQKMSPREMKEEFKQSEGDPAIKGKMKQLRTNRSRKRMMANVPKAAVIITNPTHYSIALQYERGMEAPICVAKGVDAVALKIREVAGQHSIPIVENPPLARALHATVEVDQAIPVEHYKAVAEVIGYVMRLRRAVVRQPSQGRH